MRTIPACTARRSVESAAFSDAIGCRPGSDHAIARSRQTVRQRIKRYFERLAAPETEKTLRRGCFAANTAAELGRGDPAAAKIVRGTFERMERVLEATLVEGQKNGELDDGVDPTAVASLLLATLVGITVLAKVDSSPARTRRIALALASLL